MAVPAPDVLSPDGVGGGHADHAGSDHGAVGLRGALLRRRRLAVDHFRPPGGVGRVGRVRLLVRSATAGALHAAYGISGLRRHDRVAGSGAHSGYRPGGQRHPGLVRGRRPVHAALRTGQDRLRRLGCAPAGGPPDGAGHAAGDAGPATPRRGHRTGADRLPARPRPDGLAGHHPAGPAVVRRVAAQGVPQFAAGHGRRRRGAGDLRGLPVRPGAILAGSQRRPARRGVSGPAGQVRAGQRGRLRRRTGPGHREVELPAQCPQRLHLRHRRRGTRIHRSRGSAGVVRGVRLHRDADRQAVRRPVPATDDSHRDGLGDRSGVYQRRIRNRPAAGHRHPAASDFGRRNINGDNAVHGRPDGQCGPA